MKFRWDKKYLYWGITALLVIGASICLFFLMFRGANFKDGVSKIIAISMPIIDGLILAYLLTPVLNFIEHKALKYIFKKKRGDMTEKQRDVYKRQRGNGGSFCRRQSCEAYAYRIQDIASSHKKSGTGIQCR